MKSRIFKATLLEFLMLFCLFGCAQNENYMRGNEMAQSQRWEEAATFFEKALTVEPNNQDYREALNKANQQAARVIYERSNQDFNKAKAESLADIENIARSMEKATRLDPGNKMIRAFSQKLADRISEIKAKLKTIYEQAESDMQKEDWMAAIDKYRQINKIYLNYEEIGTRLMKAEQEGAKILYQQGLTLRKQEDWKMASQAFKSLMDMNPNYYDVAKLYQEAQSRDNFDYYNMEGENAGRAQNWDRAIMLFEKALEYQPENAELRSKVESMKTKVAQIYFADAVKLVNDGIFSRAINKLESAKAYVPALQDDSSFKDFINKFISKLIERADRYAEKDLWGNAYLWLTKAELFNPNNPGLFQKVLDAKDNINKRIRKSIAVFDFSSPSNAKDAGKIAANKLIAFLHKNASADLRIIERENLQSILREMQLGQTGLVDIKAAQSLGKMRGIDTFVMGDVLQYSTKPSDTPSVGQARVLLNEEDVVNPDYTAWQAQYSNLSKEEKEKPPLRTSKKYTYENRNYKLGTARITAMIEVSYKLIDTSTGENIFTNTMAGKSVKEGNYQDGVPGANIPYLRLELPSEEEVLDELTNAKVSEVGQSVLIQYQSLEVEYFNQAQLQEKRRNYDLAVEKYTDAIFDEKLKSLATPVSQKSQETINNLIKDK